MTSKEITCINSALLDLADCTETLTGNERKTLIALMESLNVMAGGTMGDIESWLMLTEVDLARRQAAMN
jgi:hypothetical protein